MILKHKNIALDFWGTLAYIDTNIDFIKSIADEIGISKNHLKEHMLSNWFLQDLSIEEYTEQLEKLNGVKTFDKEKLKRLLRIPYCQGKLFVDVMPFIKRQEGKKLYLISDCSRNTADLIDKLDIGKYFERSFLSCKEGVDKKSGLYEIVTSELRISPESILMIGDSILEDIEIPQRYGINTLLINRRNIATPSHTYIKDFGELK